MASVIKIKQVPSKMYIYPVCSVLFSGLAFWDFKFRAAKLVHFAGPFLELFRTYVVIVLLNTPDGFKSRK